MTTHVAGHYNEQMLSFSVDRVGGGELTGAEGLDVMEIHWPAGSMAPRAGDRLAVWIDVSTPYAMAPRGEVPR